jgi:CUB domain
MPQVVNLSLVDITISDTSSKFSDYVFIYDGDNMNAPLIATLSGPYTPLYPYYMSSQSNMLVRFVSDNNTFYKGFNFTYKSVIAGKCLYGTKLQSTLTRLLIKTTWK